jgi:hypothetical protein
MVPAAVSVAKEPAKPPAPLLNWISPLEPPGGVVGARAAMLPAVMLKFTSALSIGMTSDDNAGLPGFSWDIFKFIILFLFATVLQRPTYSR